MSSKRARFASATPATDNISSIVEKASGRHQAITEIATSKIIGDPRNNRRIKLNWNDPREEPVGASPGELEEWKAELAEIEELASTIANPNIGLIHPITVLRRGDSFHLVSGHRRVLAHKLLGRATIDSIIRTESFVRLVQFVENAQRKNNDLDETLIGVKGILDEIGVAYGPGLKPVKVAEALQDQAHMGRTSAFRWAGVVNGPAALQEAIQNRVVRVWSTVESLLRLPEDEMIDQLAILAESADSAEEEGSRPGEGQGRAEKAVRGASATGVRRPKDYVVLPKVRNTQVLKMVIERSLGDDAPRDVDWNDLKSVERAFKKMIEKLSEGAA